MMRLILALLFAFSLTTATSRAHGPQLQITNEGGRIVTHQVILDGRYDSLTPEKSVYVMPVLEDGGIWYTRPNEAERPIIGGPEYYSGPGLAFGLQVGTAAAFASGESFHLHFTDSLQYWDGVGFTDPGAEQVRAFRGSPTSMSATATTSDASPFESLAFPTISSDYDEEAHSTARFQFLGDGANPLTELEDGIYLLKLVLSSTDRSLVDSHEFYYLLHKNALDTAVAAAVANLGFPESAVQHLGQVVPEPSTLIGVLAAASMLLIARRRR